MSNPLADSPRRPRKSLVPRFRMVDRLVARLLSLRLDGELAAGRPPEWSPLLAARADYLESPKFRNELADNWTHVLGIATGTVAASGPGPRMLRKEPVAEAAAQIRELTALLRAPQPLPVLGVITARLLLTDGTGPLFNRNSTTVLSEALTDAIALCSTPPADELNT